MRHKVSSGASRVRADIAFATIDVIAVVASYVFGLAVRMLDSGVTNPSEFWTDLFLFLPFVVVVHIAANAVVGAYGHVWEHASTDEAMRVVVGNGIALVVVMLGSWAAREWFGLVVPYVTILVGVLLSVLVMGMVRFRSRLFSFRKMSEGPRILMVGTGSEAVAFARRAPSVIRGGRVVGFLTEGQEETQSVRKLAGLPVLGCVRQLVEVIEEQEVDEVVVVGSDPVRLRQVVDLCLDTEVRLRTLPAAADVMTGSAAPVDVRDIRVEDLLVREEVETDLSAVGDLIRGRTVLVTGGGGSIGSEIVRQVMGFDPGTVWVLDRDETLLHEAALRWPGPVNVHLGDIRNGESTLRAVEKIQPDIIFHAAALKHVPVLEDFPDEAVLVNVVGTRNLIEAGSRVGVQNFVLISTDKAVDPSSVMGASKRVAELLIEAGKERRDGCTYTAVRFGNVLGSRGSVIPTFVSQIQRGGPVTVTDPDMTRYFMTVDEAVQLVLQASTMADGSEVFLLDMGEPVNIGELARRLIRLAGLIPGDDIEIEYSGVRPGEKLTEKLVNGPLEVTSHSKIFEARLTRPQAFSVLEGVAEMEEASLRGDNEAVLGILHGLSESQMSGHYETMKSTDESVSASWS